MTARVPGLKSCAASLAFLAGVLLPVTTQGITNDRVLVVVNARSAVSQRIGEYYRHERAIPGHQIVRISTEPVEEVDRDTFTRDIARPITAHLLEHRLVDQILVIVLTKGVPLKVRGRDGPNGTEASVDSELTLLYRTLVQGPVPLEGRIANPYFRADDPRPFDRANFDIYLVTRLDGYTWEHIRGLVDRANTAASTGKVILEMKPAFPGTGTWQGNGWLKQANSRLKGRGLQVRLSTSPVVPGEANVIGYAGWGSNDRRYKARSPGFRWLPGAIASWFVSTSARTFESPPAGWTVGLPDADPKTFYAGSPQSLIGDLIAEGVTGAVGFVYEPYLDGTARPDILFPAYRAGLSLAESFYSAVPNLSWQAVVIGDPLGAPFAPTSSSRAMATPGISLFLERRAAVLEDLVKRTSLGDARRALAVARAQQAEEELRAGRLYSALTFARNAVAVKPDEPAALYMLGVVHQAREEWGQAEAAFRALVRAHPTSPWAKAAERWLRR